MYQNEYGIISIKKFSITHDAGKTGFVFELLLGSGNESVIFSIKTLGAGNCIKANNVMRITFADSSLIGVIGSQKYNCTGMSTVCYSEFRENRKDLELIKTKLVQSIFIETEQGTMERELTLTEAKTFQKK